MNLGLRSRVPFPREYRGFSLVRTHGRVLATPPGLDCEEMLDTGSLFSHPGVLSAASLEEIQQVIDALDPEAIQPTILETYRDYHLVRHRGLMCAVKAVAWPVDLDLPQERQRGGVVVGTSLDDLRAHLDEQNEATPVEFAGWLPIFEHSGNCGRHPQFTHTARPPEGYHFTWTAPRPKKLSRFWKGLKNRATAAALAVGKGFLTLRSLATMFVGGPRVGLRNRARVLAALVRLYLRLRRGGARLGPTLRFLQSRHYQSQLLQARTRDLTFLTSFPFTFGQNPWMVEIEDPTTLFFPMVHNGRTSDLRIHESPFFPVVKTLLESDHCKGIVTHMRSTAQLVPKLFGSETIRQKVFYTPLGVQLPARWQKHEGSRRDSEEIHLLFINSWHQLPSNFYLRGGLDILEAFDTLRIRYPQLRLTIRSRIPPLDEHYHRILESGWVRVINRFSKAETMADLHAQSHIYLLPAARVHIVSLLQAMSYGLAVVASDGWGFDEYVEHERNGLMVRGRYGKVSWADHEAGLLREDYEPMFTSDPQVVEGIIEAVSRLVEDRQLRARLGRAARSDVETRYNLDNWNAGLKRAFDQALGRKSATEVVLPGDTVLAHPRA
ncbi:MAG: glycosyltransferase family 4 protein [Gemmataceae bacterium]